MTKLALILLLVPLVGAAEALSAEDIMRRVAENQGRAQEARKQFVYDMNVFVRLKRGNGKLAREESREYVVAPGAEKAARKLVKVEGKVLDGKKELKYSEPKYRVKGLDVDGEITDSFAGEIMWSKGQFGPMVDWFPLTAQRQRGYAFRLNGEERYREHDVYKIDYSSTDQDIGDDDDCWSGEALIDKAEFQPVLVTAHWTCRIPTAVKLMLGTNVRNIGAKINFERFGKDTWFPVNCGGELKLRVLFGYARTIAFSAKNSGFRKADVQTAIEFEGLEDKSPSPSATPGSTP